MSNHYWKKEIFTIPNILSLFRLLLIPVYTGLYLRSSSPADFYLAGSVLALSCLTDIADGKIARQCNMGSTAGKLLDPLADKLTQFFLLLTLLGKQRLLLPVMVLFLVKELFQCTALIVFARRGKMLQGALLSGKICTTVLFVSLTILMLFPHLGHSAVKLLIGLDIAFLCNSFYNYILAYFGKDTKLVDFRFR